MIIIGACVIPPQLGHSCFSVCSVPHQSPVSGEWRHAITMNDFEKMQHWETPKKINKDTKLKVVNFDLWLLGTPMWSMIEQLQSLMYHKDIARAVFPYAGVYVSDKLQAVLPLTASGLVSTPPITPTCNFRYEGPDRYRSVASSPPGVYAVGAAEWAFNSMKAKTTIKDYLEHSIRSTSLRR